LGEERAGVATRLAELTGLSERYLEQTHLRPEIFRFAKELLRDHGLTIGRLDSSDFSYIFEDAVELD